MLHLYSLNCRSCSLLLEGDMQLVHLKDGTLKQKEVPEGAHSGQEILDATAELSFDSWDFHVTPEASV